MSCKVTSSPNATNMFVDISNVLYHSLHNSSHSPGLYCVYPVPGLYTFADHQADMQSLYLHEMSHCLLGCSLCHLAQRRHRSQRGLVFNAELFVRYGEHVRHTHLVVIQTQSRHHSQNRGRLRHRFLFHLLTHVLRKTSNEHTSLITIYSSDFN